ncbi:DUF4198 domain-containing protein [soil metagenome]
MNRFASAAAVLSLVAALAVPMVAEAHRPWILPSSTVLSGEDAWVGIDAGISNGVFEADHASMRLDGMTITAPDGTSLPLEHPMQGQYRSTFDAHLTQAGTYRIGSASVGVQAAWMLNGVPGRWRGPAADLAANVPAGATDVVSAPNASRLETFVTLGEPSTAIFKPTGQGIEMVPVTHPNDLVSGEPATFQLLKDGQPLVGADVTVIRGAGRYRDTPGDLAVKTGDDGRFSVTWPEAGMYWINTVVRPAGYVQPERMEPMGPANGPRPEGSRGPEGPRGPGGPPVAMASYTAVLEVLP